MGKPNFGMEQRRPKYNKLHFTYILFYSSKASRKGLNSNFSLIKRSCKGRTGTGLPETEFRAIFTHVLYCYFYWCFVYLCYLSKRRCFALKSCCLCFSDCHLHCNMCWRYTIRYFWFCWYSVIFCWCPMTDWLTEWLSECVAFYRNQGSGESLWVRKGQIKGLFVFLWLLLHYEMYWIDTTSYFWFCLYSVILPNWTVTDWVTECVCGFLQEPERLKLSGEKTHVKMNNHSWSPKF